MTGASIALAIWLGSLLASVISVPSVLLERRDRPVTAMSWLLALFAVPPVALVAWWLVGWPRIKHRQRRRRRASEAIGLALAREQGPARPHDQAGKLARHLPATLDDSVFPPTVGNRVRLLPDTRAVHDCWRDLIADADDHLHLLFYTWDGDETGGAFRDLLVEKAEAGCEVRVLLDAVGCNRMPRGFMKPLQEAGGVVAGFMPVHLTKLPRLNFRNHRKLVIADGERAYTGGVNVSDAYLNWQDVGLQLDGPGVRQLQEIFVGDWYFATNEELTADRYFPEPGPVDEDGAVCETVASGPEQPFNAMREMLFLAIIQCRERLWIATPYFLPDQALMQALRAAIYRGVDVRLYVPKKSDSPLVRRASRVFYPALLAADIRLHEYDGMLHAKTLLFDDDFSVIGSTNLDARSFRLNFETGTFVTSKPLNAALAELFGRIEQRSERIGREHLARHPYLGQLQDAVANLLSPLM
jgi:cardiolipin synthase A/B